MSTWTPAETLADLIGMHRNLPPERVAAVLAEIWPRLHAPLRHHGTAALVTMFRHAGYVTDSTGKPDDSLVIYRGEPADPAGPGIAWSAEREVAISYARRYSTAGPTRVLQATAPPMAVLARFASEDEVVVQPDLLIDVKTIGHLPHFILPNLAPGLHFTAFSGTG